MIKKCLFPAAGYGTRFLPATKAVPKEMLPILNKPLLQYGVEEALSAGIMNMAVITGRGKRAIEDHFDNAYEIESQLIGTSKENYLNEIKEIINNATFTYVRQKQMLGLGHAILSGEPLIGDEPFMVILADDFCDNDSHSLTSQMLEVFGKNHCSVVAVQEVPLNETVNYGVVDGSLTKQGKDTFLVSDLVEKPKLNEAPSNMAIIGRYILTPDIFQILKNIEPNKNGEIQITDALKVQAKRGKVIAFKYSGKRFDCGSIKGYLEAINYLAAKQGLK